MKFIKFDGNDSKICKGVKYLTDDDFVAFKKYYRNTREIHFWAFADIRNVAHALNLTFSGEDYENDLDSTFTEDTGRDTGLTLREFNSGLGTIDLCDYQIYTTQMKDLTDDEKEALVHSKNAFQDWVLGYLLEGLNDQQIFDTLQQLGLDPYDFEAEEEE